MNDDYLQAYDEHATVYQKYQKMIMDMRTQSHIYSPEEQHEICEELTLAHQKMMAHIN